MFIFDSDFLIHAYRYDFPPGPNDNGFWGWLDGLGYKYKIIIPEKVFNEIKAGTDGLIDVINGFKNITKEPKASAAPHLSAVMGVYGVSTDKELEILEKKADPYLVAHGFGLQAIVVTNEVSQPTIINPVKKKVPDICSMMGVACIRYPRFLWEMQKGS